VIAAAPIVAVRGLKLQDKNWRNGCECGKNLEREDERRLAGSLRQPLDRKERHNRDLGAHKELPDVGGRSFIGFVGGAEHREVDYDSSQSRQRHRDGQERARLFQ
jgi:hypothetical protein